MSYSNYNVIDDGRGSVALSRSFFTNVYKYMFFALAISGGLAYYASTSFTFLSMMFNESGLSGFGYVIIFSPILVVIAIQSMVNRLSFGVILFLYVVYSVLIGLSLSFIFLLYTSSSIALTFFVTAGAFGSMALLGYFTKTDLSKLGSLLYMLFIGMFIASIVNVFMGSDTMDYVISFLGLFVFTGLTAWEMQKLKAISGNTSLAGDERKKMELIGGLQLYVLFINLFLSILRFVGDRN